MNLKDHLEKLPYFFEVAKTGSIRQAAERLYITQPSITKSIKILEDAIGRQLFTRLPRGMVLTQEGEVLLKYCYQLFSHLSDLEKSLAAPNDPMAGSLKVGTYDSIAIYFWPNFLRTFLSKYPKLDLQLTTNRSRTIQQMVEKGELDLGLIIEPEETNQAMTINLGKDQFRFYKSAEKKPIYSAKQDAPLIYMPDAMAGSDQAILDKFIGRLNDDPKNQKEERKLYQTSSLESVKELTLNGIGLGLLPKMVANEEVSKGRLKEVRPTAFRGKVIGEHNLGIVYSKHRENSPVLIKLIEELQSQKLSS